VPEERLRIVLTIHHSLDWNTGAPGSTLHLRDALRARGHDVTVVGFDHLPAKVDRRLKPLAFPWFVGVRSAGLLFRHDVDVVEASSGDLWPLPRSLVRRSPAAVLTRSHGLEHFSYRMRVEAARAGETTLRCRYFVYHGGERLHEVARSLRIADVALFANAEERQWAVDHLRLSENAVVARNGIPPALVGLPLRAPVERPRLAVLGGFTLRKGAREAAAVLSKSLAKWPQLHATWFGANSVLVHDVVDAGVRSRLDVVPHYELTELPRLLGGHEILLHLARSEGFGNVIIEAMACGLVPIASDIQGPHDILHGKGAGTLVARGDIQAATEAISRLLEHPEDRQRMRVRISFVLSFSTLRCPITIPVS